MMTAFAVEFPRVDEPIDSDLHLARRCAAGDPDAFESIYHAHAERMKSIAYHHLGNVADAEDAVQETFLKIHRAASTYTGEAAFGTWLYRILINTCYDAAAMQLDDMAHDRKTEAQAADAPRRRAVRLLEAIEYVRQEL